MSLVELAYLAAIRKISHRRPTLEKFGIPLGGVSGRGGILEPLISENKK